MAEPANDRRLKLGPGEKLVLASASPRRRELLEKAGIPFVCMPSDEDESQVGGLPPFLLVQALAELKARSVAGRLPPGTLVLGADTVVLLDGRIFGKPADREEAARMLKAFSGRIHQVATGVFIARTAEAPESWPTRKWTCTSDVKFRKLDMDDIAAYHALVNPLDKAGGYAVQEHGEMVVEGVEGLLSNVVGLPVEEVAEVVLG